MANNVGPPTVYGALIHLFQNSLGFSYCVAEDLANRADDVVRNWLTSSHEVNATCCANMELEVYQDCDDPLVWAVDCVNCHTGVTYINNRYRGNNDE